MHVAVAAVMAAMEKKATMVVMALKKLAVMAQAVFMTPYYEGNPNEDYAAVNQLDYAGDVYTQM
jgi:hypothetical protein